jgi:hypothetical protein
VGRVILARNPSSGALPTLLVRGLGTSCAPGCDASDARELFFASDEAVAELGGLTVDLCCWDVATFLAFAVPVALVRLADRLGAELALATEAVVCAVAAAGKRTGFVGDRGCVLLVGDVGDVPLLTPLLVGTESDAFGLLDCVVFDPAGGRDLRAGFGKVGDWTEAFEVVSPDTSAAAD